MRKREVIEPRYKYKMEADIFTEIVSNNIYLKWQE